MSLHFPALSSVSSSRVASFPRSHAPTGPVVSLDDAEAAATAAAKQREHSAGSSQDDDADFPPEHERKWDDHELLKTRTPLLTGNDVNAKREEIREYFHKTFSLYESLFDVLANESTYFMQPEKLRHPLIFYFGHTAVFFINKLRLAGLLTGRINESLESTLAVGVDEMSWDDLNTAHYDWPSVQQVREYRDLARVTVDDLISSLPLTLPITWESPFWVILMGCEHERIHLETSSVLFRQLPVDEVRALPMWDHCKQFRSRQQEVPANALVSVPAGTVVAGNSRDTHRTYGWDLEYGTLTSHVAGFEASQFLASNAEFYEFVLDGGYRDAALWGEEGWKFVQFRSATCPTFWVPVPPDDAAVPHAADADAGADSHTPAALPVAPRYRYRTMTSVIDMPWDWPVDVNYMEAKAFCAWKNRQRAQNGLDADGKVYRLVTEAEYMRLRDHAFPERSIDPATGETRINDQPFWSAAPGNINLEHGASSCPVDRFAFGGGFFDVIGNAWQWTETPLMPFRGFQFHPMYDDFSVPTFDTRHNVFCGGSWISTGNEATRMARFAFRRHFYQHASFRYVLAAPLSEKTQPTQAMCETDPAVTHMMEAQFNDAAQNALAATLHMQPMPNYALRVARIAIQVYKQHARTMRQGTQTRSHPTDAASGVAAPAVSDPITLSSPGPRAIDLGCACGRSTFELAKLAAVPAGPPLFNHIVGLDFSTRFIRIAAQLQFEQHAEYAMRKEGDLFTYHSIESVAGASPLDGRAVAPLPPPPLPSRSPPGGAGVFVSSDALPSSSSSASVVDLDLRSAGMLQRVEFMQGDVCNLGSKFREFDLVLASNLIEYLYDPKRFLTTIGARMRPGAILVLASSYSWDEQYTPKAHWLGGVKDSSGESVDSQRAVAELLRGEFDALPECAQEMPIIWKTNQRNFTLKFVHVTAWRKK